jgi:hypothetical protein
MSLTVKQKALLGTFGVFAVAITLGIAIDFISRNVSVEVLTFAAGGFIVFMLANMVYQLMISKFEYDEKVTKIVDGMVDKK